MSTSRRHEQRRRQQRSTASVVAKTAATTAVVYSTYRLAQWYFNEDDEFQEGTEHPLEEDIPYFSTEENNEGSKSRKPKAGDGSTNIPRDDSSNYSWLSTTTFGLASRLAGAGVASLASLIDRRNGGDFTERLTRRQQLTRCQFQTRIAFYRCFQALIPVLERLTDSSRQTKELKALRRQRQAMKQQTPEQQENDESCNSSAVASDKQLEREFRELQEREDDLWCDILVETTTRMMVASYAYTLLLLSLTVQFHWLSSSKFSDSCEEEQREQEKMLLRSHQYFLNDGIPLLVSTVRRSVERVFFDDDDIEEEGNGYTRSGFQSTNGVDDSCLRWTNPSSQFVSSDVIEQHLYKQLHRNLDNLGVGGRQRRNRRRRRNWVRFVLPDEEAFDPVWDICKSPFWEDAQQQVLDHLWYNTLRDGEIDQYGWGEVFRANKSSCDTSGENGGKGGNKEHHQQQPLAKVIACFKKATSALFDEAKSSEGTDGETRSKTIVGKMQTLPTVLELAEVSLTN